MNTTIPIQNNGLVRGNTICLSANWLNQESDNAARMIEKTNANTTTKKDSLKNCRTNCAFIDPIALRIPTSFSLFSERGVLKFIKLIQASNKTKMPTIPNNQTNVIRPSAGFPFLNSEYKCHVLIGTTCAKGLYSLTSAKKSCGKFL